MLISDDGKEVKDGILHVEIFLASSQTKISVNVKKPFKTVKRYS